MNYELARLLKDSGFPHEWEMFTDGELNQDNSLLPTLEELIQACGESFGSLYQSDNGWIADKGIHQLKQDASTPSEAVAKLWLALNKK